MAKQQDFNSYWEDYDETVAEQSGAGGIVCEALIEVGYKVYVGDVKQYLTWFPTLPGKVNEKARKVEFAKAKAFGQESGADRGPQWGIQIKAFLDGAKSRGEDATWKDDRTFNVDSWVSAHDEVVVPSLRENGIILPYQGWVRIGFKDDPYGSTETDNRTGEDRIKQIAYIVEVFPDKAIAYTSAGGDSEGSSGGASSDVPPNYTAKGWAAVVPAIQADLESGKDVGEIAKEYEIPVKFVAALVE